MFFFFFKSYSKATLKFLLRRLKVAKQTEIHLEESTNCDFFNIGHYFRNCNTGMIISQDLFSSLWRTQRVDTIYYQKEKREKTLLQVIRVDRIFNSFVIYGNWICKRIVQT